MAIENKRTETRADGSVWALQMDIVKGKRPMPKGWVCIKPAPAAAASSPATKKPALERPSRKAKSRKASEQGSSSAAPRGGGENVLAWVLGAAATAAVILGGLYVLANRSA